MKYTIKKVFETDGIWFRAYDEKGYVDGTVDDTQDGCERRLRYGLMAKKERPQVVKKLEIP